MKHSGLDSATVHNVGRLRRSGRVGNSGPVLIWGAALAMALCVGPLSEVRAYPSRTPDGPSQGYQAAEQLLQRAGDTLGGAERLRAIDRLHITTVEWRNERPEAVRARTFKLWLPDRFQSHVDGVVTHTLNGDRLTFDREVPPELQRNAEKAIPAMFRRVALAFLLRAPGLGAPRLHGEATIAGLSGTLVEFAAADGRNLKLLLAPTTGHPLALVYPVRVIGSNEELPDQVWRLEDYRGVDGVRFPFRLTVVHPESELITEVREIKVNPPFTPADFPK
jgi:hypothetical protein